MASTREEVHAYIAKRPGINTDDLCSRFKISRDAVNFHLAYLYSNNRVTREMPKRTLNGRRPTYRYTAVFGRSKLVEYVYPTFPDMPKKIESLFNYG